MKKKGAAPVSVQNEVPSNPSLSTMSSISNTPASFYDKPGVLTLFRSRDLHATQPNESVEELGDVCSSALVPVAPPPPEKQWCYVSEPGIAKFDTDAPFYRGKGWHRRDKVWEQHCAIEAVSKIYSAEEGHSKHLLHGTSTGEEQAILEGLIALEPKSQVSMGGLPVFYPPAASPTSASASSGLPFFSFTAEEYECVFPNEASKLAPPSSDQTPSPQWRFDYHSSCKLVTLYERFGNIMLVKDRWCSSDGSGYGVATSSNEPSPPMEALLSHYQRLTSRIMQHRLGLLCDALQSSSSLETARHGSQDVPKRALQSSNAGGAAVHPLVSCMQKHPLLCPALFHPSPLPPADPLTTSLSGASSSVEVPTSRSGVQQLLFHQPTAMIMKSTVEADLLPSAKTKSVFSASSPLQECRVGTGESHEAAEENWSFICQKRRQLDALLQCEATVQLTAARVRGEYEDLLRTVAGLVEQLQPLWINDGGVGDSTEEEGPGRLLFEELRSRVRALQPDQADEPEVSWENLLREVGYLRQLSSSPPVNPGSPTRDSLQSFDTTGSPQKKRRRGEARDDEMDRENRLENAGPEEEGLKISLGNRVMAKRELSEKETDDTDMMASEPSESASASTDTKRHRRRWRSFGRRTHPSSPSVTSTPANRERGGRVDLKTALEPVRFACHEIAEVLVEKCFSLERLALAGWLMGPPPQLSFPKPIFVTENETREAVSPNEADRKNAEVDGCETCSVESPGGPLSASSPVGSPRGHSKRRKGMRDDSLQRQDADNDEENETWPPEPYKTLLKQVHASGLCNRAYSHVSEAILLSLPRASGLPLTFHEVEELLERHLWDHPEALMAGSHPLTAELISKIRLLLLQNRLWKRYSQKLESRLAGLEKARKEAEELYQRLAIDQQRRARNVSDAVV